MPCQNQLTVSLLWIHFYLPFLSPSAFSEGLLRLSADPWPLKFARQPNYAPPLILLNDAGKDKQIGFLLVL